jgi:hypothetical protein
MNIYDYLFSDDEEEQEKGKDALYEAVVDTIQSDLQGLGVPGLVGDMGMNILRNREAFNNIPILDMVENIAKGGAESLRVLADGGDITTDMGESRLNNLYRVLGVKNVRDAINSTYQAYNGDLSFYDALMNRWKTEEQIEKGEKAIWEKSPKETKDWIYDWWFRETYDAPDLGPEWVQDGLNITNGMEGVFGNYEDPFESNWDHMENLVDWSNYDGSVSNLEYTEKAEDLQNVYRDYKDIEVKKRAQESNIKQKEKGKSSSDDLTPEQQERWDALLKEVFDEN